MIKSKMEEYYSRRIFEYEEIYNRPERQKELAILTPKLRIMFKDLDVLEIACGTGYWTQFISHQARSILATDLSEEAIRFANQKEYSRGNVTFIVDDAYSLSHISGDFNGGFCGFWLSHIPKNRLKQCITTFQGKLKSGATIVFIDNNFVEGNSTPISRYDEENNSYQIRKLSNGSRYEVLKNFPDEQEIKQAIARDTSHIEFLSLDYYWLIQYQLR